MNILCIIETDVIGGPGKGILQLLNAFKDTEIHLHICGFAGRNIQRKNEFKMAVVAGGHSFCELYERFRFDPATLAQARQIITDRKIDIIQTHGYKGNTLAFVLRRNLNIPWVSFMHGWTNEDFKIRIFNILDRWLLRTPDRIVTVSQAMKLYLESYGLQSGKINVVPNAVVQLQAPEDSRERIRITYGISTNSPLIGVIGRLSQEKGQLDFLKAMQYVAREIPGVRALIIGDGPDRLTLENFSVHHNLSHCVIFAGYQSNIAEIYAALDIVVMPSLSEGMPNVALEAIACSKPLVATRVCGVPEVVQHNRTGFLIPPADPEEMAKQILFLLKNFDRCRELTENGKQDVVERFSLQARIQHIQDIYKDLLTSNLATQNASL